MTWDARDALGRSGRRGRKRSAEVPGGAPPATPLTADDALPTVAQAMRWDASVDEALLGQRLTQDEERELRSQGWLSARQWRQLGVMMRRGIHEL